MMAVRENSDPIEENVDAGKGAKICLTFKNLIGLKWNESTFIRIT